MDRAPLAWAASGIVAGVLLGDLAVPPLAWSLFGALALLAASRFLKSRPLAASWALAAAGLSVGALCEVSALQEHGRNVRESLLVPGSVVRVAGEVLERVDEPSGRIRWRIALPGALRVTASLRGEAGGRPGERVEMTGMLRAFGPPANPGGFDGGTWARHEGMLGTLSVGGAEGVRVLGPASGVLPALRRVREVLRRRIEIVFPGREGPLLGALLLGVREPLEPDLSDAFLETGTVHYLSVSGTHVLIALGALSWILRALPVPPSVRALLCIGAALAYAALTGMQAPVLRASIGASLAWGAVLMGRPRAGLNAVAAAAGVLALADPAQVFRAGFQLSFLATLGILLMARGFSRALEDRVPEGRLKRLRRYAVSGTAVSLSAWLSVIPLVARQFHLVTPGVVPANLAVFPLVAALMLAGALGLACPPLAWIARLLFGALEGTVEAFSRLPGSHAYVGGCPAWLAAAFYAWLAFLAWRLSGRGKARWPVLAGSGLLLLASALAWGALSGGPRGLRVAMIDVRQGLCILVQAPDGGTLLYDCGAYADPEAGARTMAPALWAMGVRRIDCVVLSHGHDDHFNGLAALRRRFRIGRVMTSRDLSAGDRLEIGSGAVAEVLCPARAGPALSENDRSVCLRIVPPRGAPRVLLTGDLGEAGTALLLASGRDLSSEILLLPHHGAALATLPALLSAVRPREAWISAREGFPSPATLATLSGVRIRGTWSEGAVILETGP